MRLSSTLFCIFLLAFNMQAFAGVANLRGVLILSPDEDLLEAKQSHVVKIASQQLGRPYRYGGQHPHHGFDCSGLVRYVYQKTIKDSLPRTAAELGTIGQAVSRSELQAGDLVFFNTSGKPYSHVGIYLSQQKFIHAPSDGKKVSIATLKHNYWKNRFLGAKRILVP